MVKTIDIGYYFVAFIDMVGQRDRLKQWTKLTSNNDEREGVKRILLGTSEYVRELRAKFNTSRRLRSHLACSTILSQSSVHGQSNEKKPFCGVGVFLIHTS